LTDILTCDVRLIEVKTIQAISKKERKVSIRFVLTTLLSKHNQQILSRNRLLAPPIKLQNQSFNYYSSLVYVDLSSKLNFNNVYCYIVVCLKYYKHIRFREGEGDTRIPDIILNFFVCPSNC